MSLLLNIDTAADIAFINIAEDGFVIAEEKNTDQKDHAAFLQPTIQSMVKKAGITLNDIEAIAVAYGPGSYTGLRVGIASAKGLCFALNKPLITVGSLDILATAAASQSQNGDKNSLFCPMIDARRMEVFTAIYDHNLNVILPPCALILDVDAYFKVLLNNKVCFFGSGALKWQEICKHKNAEFITISTNGLAMSKLSFEKLVKREFADTALSEPLYIKEFYFSQMPVKK